MKFMQRAAAASPSSPGTPTSDEAHSSKRRKTAGRSSLGMPETPSYVIDQKAAHAALAEEERKRQVAVEKRAEQLGDSHWVLDSAKLPGSRHGGMPLKIVQVGFSQIDRRGGSEEDQEQDEMPRTDGPVFQSYGPKKSKGKKDEACISPPAWPSTRADILLQNVSESDSDSNSDSDSDDSDSSVSSSEGAGEETSQTMPGRASYGSQKRGEFSRQTAEREKTKKLAAARAARRTKEVKLNRLTSISGAGSFGSKGSNPPRRR